MHTTLPVENGDILATVRGFLHSLLDSGTVEAVFVPMRSITRQWFQPWSPIRLLDRLIRWPFMPINNARAVSALTAMQLLERWRRPTTM